MLNRSNGILLDGDIKVYTTQNRGFTPEEIAERAIEKIIYVGKDSHPAIRDQAEAFKKHIYAVLVQSLQQAVQSDRTTVANRLRDAGHPELIKILEDKSKQLLPNPQPICNNFIRRQQNNIIFKTN